MSIGGEMRGFVAEVVGAVEATEVGDLQSGVEVVFCVVMFGLINVNILYYSFSTLYQMCNLRQSL